jgi:EAL domain-containing protein (putative c-di-GMP-specific phosphodiesterase class I)
MPVDLTNQCEGGTSENAGSILSSAALGVPWMLHRQISGGTLSQIPVRSTPFTIGRSSSNELTISDLTVSGHHAELLLVDSDLFIRDLNSTNGTFLNGRRIRNLTGMKSGDVIHFGSVMFTLNRNVSSTLASTVTADVSREAIAQLQFDSLLRRRAIRPYFQPIVRLKDRGIVGYEILSRSSMVGLETPALMFRVAEERTAAVELSRMARSEGLRCAGPLGNSQLYVNTHPSELNGESLFPSLHALREQFPELQIVVEVHEAAATSTKFLQSLRDVLNDLGMNLAYDDFGAGQARLKELVDVPPDVLKFDVRFIQGLPFSTEQQRSTIRSLLKIVRDLNVIPLAEGVETAEEAAISTELGFDLVQGYLFGRPAPVSYWASGRTAADDETPA